jgi:hypothetical protein
VNVILWVLAGSVIGAGIFAFGLAIGWGLRDRRARGGYVGRGR